MKKAAQNVVLLDVPDQRRWYQRFRLRYILLAGFLVWGIYEYAFVQKPIELHEKATYLALQTQLSQTKAQSEALSNQIVALHSNAYVAQIAQKDYNLILPGEVLFSSNTSHSNSGTSHATS